MPVGSRLACQSDMPELGLALVPNNSHKSDSAKLDALP